VTFEGVGVVEVVTVGVDFSQGQVVDVVVDGLVEQDGRVDVVEAVPVVVRTDVDVVTVCGAFAFFTCRLQRAKPR
jgi:hypothetical protein